MQDKGGSYTHMAVPCGSGLAPSYISLKHSNTASYTSNTTSDIPQNPPLARI